MTARYACLHCLDTGIVCEDHPAYPWEVTVEGHRAACGAGAPCAACCSPIPEDGTTPISLAFIPDDQRPRYVFGGLRLARPGDPVVYDVWNASRLLSPLARERGGSCG